MSLPQARSRVGTGVALVVVAFAVVAAFWFGPLVTLPAAVAVAGLVVVLAAWSHGPHRLALVTGVSAAGSLVATVVSPLLASPDPGDVAAGLAGLVELAALMVLVVLLARFGPARPVLIAGGLVVAAAACWPLRLRYPATATELVAGGLFWALIMLVAAGGGGYLRWLDAQRRQSVRTARQVQRLELARDLHDFVAHDVSAMLAQAQAGQLLVGSDPARAALAFQHIEKAGLEALAALDRTVQMLHDADEPPHAGSRTPLPGLADLRALVDRFTTAGSAAVRLHVDESLGSHVEREVDTTVYRIVSEALTNVRRHAPAARTVDITASRAGRTVELTVTNDEPTGASGPGQPGRGGHGLVGLTERVEALGGRFGAGRYGTGRWRVSAVLPLRPAAREVRR
jgi:signal transduction histidine kinase